LLLGRDELNANRHGNADQLAHLRELAAGLIDLEHGDIIGALIARDDVCAGWINAEISRRSAERFLMADRGQLARFFIDGKDRQAIVAAVGAI